MQKVGKGLPRQRWPLPRQSYDYIGCGSTYTRAYKASTTLPPFETFADVPGAPTTLPRRLLLLTQSEIEEASKFIQEHLARNTIRPSWSPYAANFFFVKKKDGKLQPVQDYRPLNKWTKRNCNVSPLIPSVIDRLAGCMLFTKFDV